MSDAGLPRPAQAPRGPTVSLRQANWLALGAFLLGLVVTAAIFRALSTSVDAEMHARFDGAVRRLEYDVQRRINVPSYGLKGLAATYSALGELSTADFRAWVAARQLNTEFPGVRGFGLVRRVERTELEEFVRRMQAAEPQFRVTTGGDATDLYVVSEVEPRGDNITVWGYDLAQERLRRGAIEQAVASGNVTLSDRIAVLQDPGRRAGWLMFLPVFRRGVDPQSAEGRKRALIGVLYAPIVAADVLADVRRKFESELDFRLYDGNPEEGSLIFDSEDDPKQGLVTGRRGGWEGRRERTTRTVTVGGQQLSLDLASTPEMESLASTVLPTAIALAGLLLSGLLALLVRQLAGGRQRAESLAQKMTADLSRVAKELSASEAFLEQAQSIGNIGGWEVDLESLALRLSAQTLRLFGLPPQASPSIEEFIGAFDAGSQERIGQATHDAVRDGTPWDLELSLVDKGGVPRWLRTVGRVERQGNRSVRLIGTLQDITDRKRAEEALQASEQLMRVVTDNLPGRVGYWNADRRCVFANRVYGETFGKTQEEMIGRTFDEVLGPERYAAYRPQIDAALRGERQTFEREETADSGARRTMLVHYIPEVVQGRVLGFFVLALDITELKEAREAAMQASAAKGQFLANTSHEIRTPMNAIIGMLALLQNTALSARQADYVLKADGAARALLGLLNDILDFSKVEAGKLALDPRVFDLEALLRDLSVILSANVRSDEVEVLYDVGPDLPAAVVGDDMRLRQVLVNLGGNAVKFTERGEVVIEVKRLGGSETNVQLEFAVSDTGIGIPHDQQARIFEGFAQAEASIGRRFGGTGLGLAISQRLVQLMGGTLQLRSEPGRGSRFSFVLELPLAAAEPVPREVQRKLRVLFADDNAVALRTMSMQAASLGWVADTASSCEEALAVVQAAPAPYDVIFVDWRMPGADGVQTANRLRRLPQVGQGVAVIMVSAQGRARFHELGDNERDVFDGYLVKPVTASMLKDAVLEATGAPSPHGAARQGSHELAGVHVLVVEDNANNQLVARELLASRGALVEVAENGREAVDRVTLGKARYDVVLMDMQMPVMDGLAATREIRRAGFAALPIVAMTANNMSGDREACMAAGMDDHVGKPFDIDELVATLLRHLARAGPAGARSDAKADAQEGVAAPRAAAPDAGATPIEIDLPAAIARLGGDAAFYGRLYPEIRADTEAMLARLAAMPAGGATEEAGRLFHTIKGLAGSLGALALARAAAAGEDAMQAAAEAGGAADAPSTTAIPLEPHVQAVRLAFATACSRIDAELVLLAPQQAPR